MTSGLRKDLIALGYFLAPLILFTGVFHEVFLFQATFSHDALFWYPNFNYFINCLAQGVLPLWDPYSFAGAPFYLSHTLLGTLDPLVLIFVPMVKYFSLDLFSAYQASYLLRFLVFYAGLYLLISSFTKNRFAVCAASHWALFSLGTCAFRQNGYLIMMTYAPLFLWALYNFLTRLLHKKESCAFFCVACITAGLTFNLYLPVYFIFASLLFGFLVIGRYKAIYLLKNLRCIPFIYLVLCILLMLGLLCPTLIILADCFGAAKSDVISLTRSEGLLESSLPLLGISQIAAPEWRGSGSWQDLWAALTPGFYSPYFVFPPHPSFTEHFFSLPLVFSVALFSPFLVRFLFHKIPYVVIPFTAMTAFVFLINPNFSFLLDFIPGLRDIRQLGNFFGYFIIFSSIIYAKLICLIFQKDFHCFPSLKKNICFSFIILICLSLIFSVYLFFTSSACFEDFLGFLPVIITSLFVFYFILRNYLRFPKWSYGAYIVLLAILNSTVFSYYLKPMVLSPIGDLGKTPFDQIRPFVFENYRHATLPRPQPFTGFISCLFLQPSLLNYFPNSYIFVSKKTMDAIRFFPKETLKSIKAFGSNILALYDKPAVNQNLLSTFQKLSIAGNLASDDIFYISQLERIPQLDTMSFSIAPVRAWAFPWDLFDHYVVFSFEEYLAHQSSDLFSCDYKDLSKQCLFLGHDFYNSQFLTDPYIFGPGFSKSVAFVESALFLEKFRARFVYNNLILNNGIEFCDKKDINFNLYRRSYNDKLFNLDLNNVRFIAASNNNRQKYPAFCKIIHFNPNYISVSFFNNKPSWFYLADSFFPGWKCFVNGHEVPVRIANFCFKTAFIEKKGETTLIFIFRPQPYTTVFCIFIPLSVFSFVMLFLIIGSILRNGKR